MANVHRWGADDWIDCNRKVMKGGKAGARGKVKFRRGVEGAVRGCVGMP